MKEEELARSTPVGVSRGDGVFGDKLRELREARGLTLGEVGKSVRTTGQHVSLHELGRAMPTVSILVRYIVFYETTFEHLCGHMVEEARS